MARTRWHIPRSRAAEAVFPLIDHSVESEAKFIAACGRPFTARKLLPLDEAKKRKWKSVCPLCRAKFLSALELLGEVADG